MIDVDITFEENQEEFDTDFSESVDPENSKYAKVLKELEEISEEVDELKEDTKDLEEKLDELEIDCLSPCEEQPSAIIQTQGGSRDYKGFLDPESEVYGINGTALGAGHRLYGDNNLAAGRNNKTYQNSSIALGSSCIAGNIEDQYYYEGIIKDYKELYPQGEDEDSEEYIQRIHLQIKSDLGEEFYNNLSLKYYSCALATGINSKAIGRCSTATGLGCQSIGVNSHAEGKNTIAEGAQSHAEGESCKSVGNNSHAEGQETEAVGVAAHAEGYDTEAYGMYSHSEGQLSRASGNIAHAEGYDTAATGYASHSEGYGTKSTANCSHAEGKFTESASEGAHAEGVGSKATGTAAHAEGYYSQVTSSYGHAEGNKTIAGWGAHSEGDQTKASGGASHAEGYLCEAKAKMSHAEGLHTIASQEAQHVQGKFNIEDTENKYAHIVGNGSNKNARANAHTLDWAGNAWFAGDIFIKGRDQDSAAAKKIATEEYVDINRVGLKATSVTGAEIFNDYTNLTALGEYSSVHGKSTTKFSDISKPEKIYYKVSENAKPTIIPGGEYNKKVQDTDSWGGIKIDSSVNSIKIVPKNPPDVKYFSTELEYTIDDEDTAFYHGLVINSESIIIYPHEICKETYEHFIIYSILYYGPEDIDNYPVDVYVDVEGYVQGEVEAYNFEDLQFTTDSTDTLGTVDKVYSYKDPYGNKRYTLWQDYYYKLGEGETVNEVSPDDTIWNSITLEALMNGGSRFSLVEGRASTVFGEDSVTSGRAAFAAGLRSIASADYAVAMGYNSVARGKHAIALGNTCKATGMNSFAIGEKAEATGYASVALGGECNVASGNYSIASGSHSVASGHMSRAIGTRCEASGEDTIAIGAYTKATEWNAIAIGFHAEAIGRNSLALGRYTKAVAEFQTVVGRANVPIDDKNATFIVGVGSDDANRNNGLVVYTNGCVGLGSLHPKSDDHATSKYYVDKLHEGALNYIDNKYTAIGTTITNLNTDFNYKITKVENNSKNYTDNQITWLSNIGTSNKTDWNTGAYVIGNQSEASGNQAYVLGYQCLSNGGKGSVAIGRGCKATGETAFAAGYNAEASGRHSVAIGRYAKATEPWQTAIGPFNAVESDACLMVGIGDAEHKRKNGLVVRNDGRVSVGADPTGDMDVVTKQYLDNLVGSINETLLKVIAQQEAIIKMQNELIAELDITNDLAEIIELQESYIGGEAE